jgi:hypothetical protein
MITSPAGSMHLKRFGVVSITTFPITSEQAGLKAKLCFAN